MRKSGIALLVVAILATLVAMANMLEYFFASKENLREVDGVVDKVFTEAFGQGRRQYTKTTIVFEGGDKYWLSDKSDVGGYIPAEKGDRLRLYVKSWYQWLYNYNWRSNIFYVERDGKMIYNNLSEWKGSGRAFMMVTAVLAALLWLIYFDVVKNKSISNWLRQQKTLTNNPPETSGIINNFTNNKYMDTVQQATTSPVQEAWNKRPLIISGPCSAETEEQVLATAQRLAATGKVNMLRAGIWKPRTKPGLFEGIGAKGLPWLQQAKKLTGLPVAVEVATAKQVQDALTFDVDVLWIGARTTVNPFSVQEVADALRGVDVPVLIKNPINPDLELWAGAVERVARAGIKNIGLIHRGFSSYGNTEYRNAPMWHLAIEMKLRHPDMPVINDPSHICGRRDILLEVMQKAVDLDYDGLMIESHIDPDNAWSDAKQQVTPEVLAEMLDTIIWRKEDIESEALHAALEKLRQKINHLDDELLQILAQRMKIAEQIGEYKKDNNITILQTNRWNEILEKAFQKGEKNGLSHEFLTRYFDAVHMESINHQKKIMDA